MNRPLPRSAYGARYDENYDRIFRTTTMCPFCGEEAKRVETLFHGVVAKGWKCEHCDTSWLPHADEMAIDEALAKQKEKP